MKIIIKSSDYKSIRLVFPTRLLLNGLTARIGAGAINKHLHPDNFKIKSGDLRRIIKEIHRIKRKYPDLVLIDLESSDGDKVQIKL